MNINLTVLKLEDFILFIKIYIFNFYERKKFFFFIKIFYIKSSDSYKNTFLCNYISFHKQKFK